MRRIRMQHETRFIYPERPKAYDKLRPARCGKNSIGNIFAKQHGFRTPRQAYSADYTIIAPFFTPVKHKGFALDPWTARQSRAELSSDV